MVFGHKEDGVFHPHSEGSGIFSSQLSGRNNTEVLPSPLKTQQRLKDFVSRKKEEFDEKEKINRLSKNKSNSSMEIKKAQEHALEERLLEDELSSVLSRKTSSIFLLKELRDFENKNHANLSLETIRVVRTEIERLQDEIKTAQKENEEIQKNKKEQGFDKLFPKGSSNPDTTKEMELQRITSEEEINKANEEFINKSNAELEAEEKKIAGQITKLDDRSVALTQQQKDLMGNKNLTSNDKRDMNKKIVASKSLVNIKKKMILDKINNTAERSAVIALVGV